MKLFVVAVFQKETDKDAHYRHCEGAQKCCGKVCDFKSFHKISDTPKEEGVHHERKKSKRENRYRKKHHKDDWSHDEVRQSPKECNKKRRTKRSNSDTRNKAREGKEGKGDDNPFSNE